MFTPVLREFYEEVNRRHPGQFEIVFVSSDRSAEEMASYFLESHGDWLGLDFAQRAEKDRLSQEHGVRGIPMLVVMGPYGRCRTTDGRQEVMQEGADAFERWL